MEDYYSVLNISKEASQEEIKKAYRKLAQKYHPDKSGGDDDKFKKINEAYETLSDPAKRRAYDNPNEGFGFDMSDFFHNHFGGRANTRPQGPRPEMGQDVKVHVSISFYELVMESSKDINISYKDCCSSCEGTGASERDTCSECKGAGMVTKVVNMQGMQMSSAQTCTSCRGMGFKTIAKCSDCQGRGFINQSRSFTFTIPPNANDGSVLRFSGQGGKGRFGGPNGSIFVKLNLQKPNKNDLTEEQLNVLKDLQ